MHRMLAVMLLSILVGCGRSPAKPPPDPPPQSVAETPPNPASSFTARPAAPRFPYSVTDLGTLGGKWSFATAINQRCQIVGCAETSDGHTSAFLWDSGSGMQNLGGPVVITGPFSDSEMAAARETARNLAVLEGSDTSDREIAGATSLIAAAKRAFVSRANAISDKGYVAGKVRTTDSGEGHAFLWTPENGMRVLSVPDEDASEGRGVSDNAQVCGAHNHRRRNAGSGVESHEFSFGIGFVWQSENGMQDLDGPYCAPQAMNRAGQVAGDLMAPRDDNPFGRAFLWQGDKGMKDLGNLPGGAGASAWGINGKGQVVGVSHSLDLVNHRPLADHMFLWEGEKGMQDLGVLSREVRPYSINDLGLIVGGSYGNKNMRQLVLSPDGKSGRSQLEAYVGMAAGVPNDESNGNPPFLYSDGKMIDLNTTIDPASGWRLITATGINDSGQIVGSGKNKAGQSHAFLLTPVPCLRANADAKPSPQSAAETPTKPQPSVKPDANPSPDEQRVPTGLVRIVNRKTRDVIWPASLFQIEPVGGYYKIRWHKSGHDAGRCLAPVGGDDRLLRHVPDSNRRVVLWEIKPVGDGCWTITNQGSGKALEMRGEKPTIEQAPLREGALEQYWRLEAVPSPSGGEAPVASGGTRPSAMAPSVTAAPSDFQLVAFTDLVYIPKTDVDVRPKARHKGPAGRRAEVALLECGDYLFHVLKGGNKPVHGFFDVSGKPVAPAWKSSDSSVLKANADPKTGEVSFAILRPGTVTVTVSVGDWSDTREIAVVQVPLALDISAHTIVKTYGYPAKKTTQDGAAAPSRRLRKLLDGAICVLFLGSGHPFDLARCTDIYSAHYVPREWNGNFEFWEYPQRWPRCILLITGLGSRPEEGELSSIITRPRQENAHDATASETPKAPAPREMKAAVPSRQ